MSTSEQSPRWGVVLFHSVQGAMAAERLLLAQGVAHKLITVPRQLSSNCGFCLRFEWAQRAQVEAALTSPSLGIEDIVAL